MNPEIQALLKKFEQTPLPEISLGLTRVTALLDALGNPQRKLPPVVHVAGTNGKGSLLAYLTAIFQHQGKQVHRYTSPHLVDFSERILLNGAPISDHVLYDALQRVAKALPSHTATYFEATTAAAFLAFAETPADILLLETGLGGRLDATNVIDAPLLTAITPVSLDHQEFLGNTLEQIAAEKAGIIKPGVACVVGPQQPEALHVIAAQAKKLGAPLYAFGDAWEISGIHGGFHYHSNRRCANFPKASLPGAHQLFNAATAIACAETIEPAISNEALATGIQCAEWPGRLQLLSGKLAMRHPHTQLWLDGGHNPAAGEMLAEWACTAGPIGMILGMLKTKDAEGFLRHFQGIIAEIATVPITSSTHAASAETLQAIASAYGFSAKTFASVPDALEAMAAYPKLLICGSLYLAGEVLKLDT